MSGQIIGARLINLILRLVAVTVAFEAYPPGEGGWEPGYCAPRREGSQRRHEGPSSTLSDRRKRLSSAVKNNVSQRVATFEACSGRFRGRLKRLLRATDKAVFPEERLPFCRLTAARKTEIQPSHSFSNWSALAFFLPPNCSLPTGNGGRILRSPGEQRRR